jgi:hypothetical protein
VKENVPRRCITSEIGGEYNMNKKALLLGFSALVIGGAMFAPHAALAYRGDPNVKGPNYTEERHLQMEKAFETKDYTAWKNLMQGKGRVTQVVNKDNFARFAEAHELAEQGKTKESLKIRQDEFGLGLHNGQGQGMGQNRNR